MTKLLDEALEAVRKAPPDMQDAVAELMLDMADEYEPEDLSSEDLAAVLEAEAQIERGEVVEGTAAELVAAAFDRSSVMPQRAKLHDALRLKEKLDGQQQTLNALREETERLIRDHGL